MPWAGKAVAGRVEAIRRVLPMGSRVIDVGCNDGTISGALLDSGHASFVYGYDLENILKPELRNNPRFHLEEVDLHKDPLPELPEATATLLLTILHHLLSEQGAQRVRKVINLALEASAMVLCDMGSLTEPHHHKWQQLEKRFWSSDVAMAKDLFREAEYVYPIHRYAAQGGHRILWKAKGKKARTPEYEVLGMYRRTVGLRGQKLYPVQNWEEAPKKWGKAAGDLCPFVRFYHLKDSETQEQYWAKRYDAPAYGGLEYRVAQALKHAPHLVLVPLCHDEQYGLIYPFYAEVFKTSGICYTYRARMADANRKETEQFAQTIVKIPDVQEWPVGWVCDFQAVGTQYGLMFLDFAPANMAIVK